jgi:hypothetical protein
MHAVVNRDGAFARVVRKIAAALAPEFSARMALALKAPKLMAEMLNTLAL